MSNPGGQHKYKNHHKSSHKQRSGRRNGIHKQEKNYARLRTCTTTLRAYQGGGDAAGSQLAATRRSGSPNNTATKLRPGVFGWYQVTVQQAQGYAQADVLDTLQRALMPHALRAQYWRTLQGCCIFFTDDYDCAVRLHRLRGEAKMFDGGHLLLRVSAGTPKFVVIDDNCKQLMRAIIAKRYNAANKALDLTKFHADADFQDTFCPLFRTSVLFAALDIVERHIPELEALNLNDNNLSKLTAFRFIERRLPQLKIIHLADNQLTSLAELLVFRNLHIVELLLERNPCCTRCKTRAQYISEVRRDLPHLVLLDGITLTPQIFLELARDVSLPVANTVWLCDASAAHIVCEFVEQYFNIYDSASRQPLLNAYHAQAMLSVCLPPKRFAGKLSPYAQYNRNLANAAQLQHKVALLKLGRLAVVSLLAALPRTEHDKRTFTLDLTLYTPALMCFTLSGLFREHSSQHRDAKSATLSDGSVAEQAGRLRYFVRNFVVVPHGAGFCIRNETIFVSNPTQLQLHEFKRAQLAASSTRAAADAPVLSELSNSLQASLQLQGDPAPDADARQRMVQAMSCQSNMHLEWSAKCLEESNWDYNHALHIFQSLSKENKIPAEAFIK